MNSTKKILPSPEEEKFRALFEASRDAIMLLDEKGFFDCNRATLEMFGVADKETFVSLHPAELSPPRQPDGTDSRTVADRKIGEAFATGHHRFEWVHRRRNGEDFPAEVWLTAFEMEGRTVLQATVRDITERNRAEEALRASERRFRAIIDQTYQFIGLLTTEGVLIDVNETALSFSGIDKADVLDKPFWEGPWWTHSAELQAKVRDAVKRVAAGDFVRFEATHPAKDGSLHFVDFSLKPVRDDTGKIILLLPEGRDITERKQIEETLQESERRLADILQFYPDPTMVIDREGRVTAWNQALEELSGVKAEDMLGKGDYEYALPFYGERRPILIDLALQDDPEMEKRYTTIARHGDILMGEAYTPKLRSGRVHLSATASVLRDSDGEIVGAIESIRDNTDRKQMEEALRESERRLADILQFYPDPTMVIDREGRVTAWNQAMEEITGTKAADMLGKGNYEYALPFYGERRPILVDLALKVDEKVERLYDFIERRGDTIYGEAYMPRLLDGNRYLNASATVLRDSEGGIVGAIESIRDITERKRTEETLRESEHRLADILQFYPDPTMVIDREGRVTAWNQALEELSGVKAQDMLGKGKYEYALPFYGERRQILIDLALQADPEIEKRYTTISRRGDILMGEAYTPKLRSGRVHLSATASVLRDSDGEIVGAIESIRDNTERKQMVEALNQAKEEADSANRAKSDFLANMSHEIRTPMNGILGMLNLALDTSLSEEQREYLVLAKSSADSLLMLINDILDFSKIEAKKLDLEDVDFELEGVIGEILPLLGVETDRKGLEFVCEIDPAVPPVLRGDPLRLKQVLINLLKNAIKFTEKGHILLKAQAEGEWEPGYPRLHFSVTDTGIGIPLEKQRLIFDSFTQSESSMTRKYGGTGLGLTISRSLVEMMGGTLWVESRPGEGSTFHFTSRFRRSHRKAEARQKRIPDLRGKRVLVIDDHAVNRMSLRKYLESWEMEVAEATDGFDGLEKIREAERENRPFPFMILDCMMPDLDGFGVIETLRRQGECRSCIIFMLSSLDQQGDRARCRGLGVAQFLVKPISPSSLFNAIIQALDLSQKREEEITPDTARPEELAALPQDMKVLVAEDNPVNQKLATRLLDKIGLSAQTAVNGLEVLKALEGRRYDLILMDVQMPEMDGVEATKRVREREQKTGEHVPIVALTAHSMVGDRERFLEAGMDDYLSKPLSSSELYQMVRKYAPRRTTPSRESSPSSREEKAGEEAPLLALDDLRSRMGGDEEVIREIFQIFLEEIARAQEKVNEALKQRDPAGPLRSAAHYFKGMSANISATALREAFQELEQRAAGGDVGDLGGLLERIWDLEKRTVTEIKAFLGER